MPWNSGVSGVRYVSLCTPPLTQTCSNKRFLCIAGVVCGAGQTLGAGKTCVAGINCNVLQCCLNVPVTTAAAPAKTSSTSRPPASSTSTARPTVSAAGVCLRRRCKRYTCDSHIRPRSEWAGGCVEHCRWASRGQGRDVPRRVDGRGDGCQGYALESANRIGLGCASLMRIC